MKRELWLDYARSFACIMVALGHLFMSFTDAAILDETPLFTFFIKLIYKFHVYIFFFASGYLFQKKYAASPKYSTYLKGKLIRCLDYLIIYVVFSAITYFTKVILSGDVNTPVDLTFIQTLILDPINQMWYMYAIFAVTLCVPIIRSQFSCYTLFFVSLLLRLLMCFPSIANSMPHPIDYLLNDTIWFSLGCIWAYKKHTPDRRITLSLLVFFIAAYTCSFLLNINSDILDVLLTFTSTLGIIGLIHLWVYGKKATSKFMAIFSKYTLQIYLLHTIFAAGIRIILLKLNIVSFPIHLIAGLIFSFIPPIICAYIAEKTVLFNIFFFPSKNNPSS